MNTNELISKEKNPRMAAHLEQKMMIYRMRLKNKHWKNYTWSWSTEPPRQNLNKISKKSALKLILPFRD